MMICGCSDKSSVEIGLIAGLSGKNADLGVAGRNGVMLAIEECNASGGIHGRSINLIVRDDQQDPKIAQEATADLIGQGVEAIIGPMTSSVAMAIVPLVNASSTIMVSPTVTTTQLSGMDDNFLRVIGSTRSYADRQARYQLEKLGHRQAVAIFDQNNGAYTESWLRDFVATYEALGGKLLRSVGYISQEKTSFYDMVSELIVEQPDVIIVISNVFDAALICQQVRKINKTIPIAMSEWASTERFIELAGRASEGVYMAQFIDRTSTSQRYQQFHEAYSKRFNMEPGFAGVAGYDAAQVVIAGMRNKSPEQTLKRAIIGQGTFKGLQQTIAVDQFGDADRMTVLSVVRNGQYVTLEQ